MKKFIDRFLKYGTLISTFFLIASVLLQIFARFFLSNTPPWTEEASRLFFIYAMAFAAGLALQSGDYVYLDYFYNKFSPRIKKIILMAVKSVTLILFGIMTVYSIQFVVLGVPEKSPSMSISMSIAFFSMVLMSASVSYYSILELIKVFKFGRL